MPQQMARSHMTRQVNGVQTPSTQITEPPVRGMSRYMYGFFHPRMLRGLKSRP